MGKQSRIKTERKAQEAAGVETAQAQGQAMEASGGTKFVVGAVLVGLLAMFLWTFAYRVDNPSLTQTPRQKVQHSTEDGHDHTEEELAAMNGEGGMKMITALMQKLQENPNDVPTLITLGEQFMRMQQWERASQLLDRAMAAAPGNHQVLNMKGIVDFNMQKYREAADKFEMILELDPDTVLAHYNLGILYGHFLEDKDKARANFEKVLASDKIDAETRKQAEEELKNLK